MAETSAPEPAHDILAAEAFAMPAPDPRFHKHPLHVPNDPNDPSGATEPHDVLAAEEFPMPAGRAADALARARPDGPWQLATRIATAAAIIVVVRQVLRRRRCVTHP
jgi:hypothetical protein